MIEEARASSIFVRVVCTVNLALQVVIACRTYYYRLCQKDGQEKRLPRNMSNVIEQLDAHRIFLLKLLLFTARINTSAHKKFAEFCMSHTEKRKRRLLSPTRLTIAT